MLLLAAGGVAKHALRFVEWRHAPLRGRDKLIVKHLVGYNY